MDVYSAENGRMYGNLMGRHLDVQEPPLGDARYQSGPGLEALVDRGANAREPGRPSVVATPTTNKLRYPKYLKYSTSARQVEVARVRNLKYLIVFPLARWPPLRPAG